ncbi:MAG: glycosyl hydrolase [Ignavibacteriaceae bacterium]|nr:glycosyl hydrolase [Ignavibacteriaceae bacterium]
MKKLVIALLIIPFIQIFSQPAKNPVAVTSAEARLESFSKRRELQEKSLFKNLPAVSIGPTIMSARIVDVDVNPANPTEFYVAYASGGLWRTSNNGTTFTSVFEDQPTIIMGDIAVNWKKHIIYAGTGEKNSSRSSYSGTGSYMSRDTGRTWQTLGLAETHRIGRIIIDRENPDNLIVAALGHLYSPNKERGIYKSSDNGITWRQTLAIDENTGAIDVIQHPERPEVLFAALWYRTRRAWDFEEAGKTSGIYKSTDHGETWSKISGGNSGFPDGEGVGRIGFSMTGGAESRIYAVVDNQERRDEAKPVPLTLTKDILRAMKPDEFIALSNIDINAYLDYYSFPEKYNAIQIKKDVQDGKLKPIHLVNFIEDGNSQLFDTPVKGAEIYMSRDEGTTWTKTHDKPIEDLVYSYGYYFGEVNAAPSNPDIVYVLGVPLIKSTDGGKTFVSVQKENAHVDHHILWINPANPDHLINGNDGGLNISYDGGKNWTKCNTPAVGQFYTVAVDNDEPYNVYGGLQDNGVWYGPSTYKANVGWHQDGHYPYTELLGGDGMEIQIDPRDNVTVYTGFQFGNYYRINRVSREDKYISPVHKLGDRPYRFNWKTPVRISYHNPDIIYIGGEKLFRSMDKGENWTAISGDLTTGGRKGDVPFSTITAFDESRFAFGTIYTGSDDGLLHYTKDGGVTWKRIGEKLPKNYWVSSLIASRHSESRVYAALNGYRWDNFEPHLYKSDDFGVSWTRLGANLPAEAINAVVEDPVNINILYVGTGHSLYISLDNGASFYPFGKSLPAAPVHALVIQEREKDLIAATHGRSLYKISIDEIQQLTDTLLDKQLHLFKNEFSLRFDKNWGNKTYAWGEFRTPGLEIPFYVKEAGEVTLAIATLEDEILYQTMVKAGRGLNYYRYSLEVTKEGSEVLNAKVSEKSPRSERKENDKYYLLPGQYVVSISAGDSVLEADLSVSEQKSKRK